MCMYVAFQKTLSDGASQAGGEAASNSWGQGAQVYPQAFGNKEAGAKELKGSGEATPSLQAGGNLLCFRRLPRHTSLASSRTLTFVRFTQSG
jgi:hypothetical protein